MPVRHVIRHQLAVPAAVGGGAWSPADLSLVGWWDASDTGSITDAGGGAVSQWNDLSGNGRHFTQSTGARRPTTGTDTINGLNVLTWGAAGSAMSMVTSSFTAAQPVTYFMVVHWDGDTSSYNGLFDGQSSRITAYLDTGSALLRVDAGSDVATGTAIPNVSVVTLTYDGASSTQRVNGVQVATANPGTNSSTGGFVVGNNLVFSAGFSGKIAEFFAATGVTTGDRDDAEDYLTAKWRGWPLTLPNLVGWWDASNAGSITASGGAVSQWNDLSGNGYHLVQATGAFQPTTGTRTLNSVNVLDFAGGAAGTADWLANESFSTASQPFAFWFVIQSDGDGGSFGRLVGSASGGRPLVLLDFSGSITFQTTTMGTASTSPHQYVALWSGASSKLWTDGTAGATADPGTQALVASFHLGEDQSAGSFGGAIAEFAVTTGTPSAGDITSWSAYTLAKWGV